MTWRRVAPAGAGWALALLATATIIAGQSSTPAAGQIAGTVTSAADNAPIGRARVAAVAAGSEPYVTLTRGDGTFVLRDLPASAYTVTVTRTGYASYTHGEGRRSAASPVHVAAGPPSHLDIALQPGRHLAGRILDEDGTPFGGAIVDALTVRFDGGRHTLVSAATARTDDRGAFRLHGLAPGEYFVSAADPAFASVTTSAGVLQYSPTYHPGVPAAADATPVVVSARGETPAIEFRLRLVPPAKVSGRVIAADRRELLSAAILMAPIDDRGAPSVPPGDPAILPDGRFSFGRVLPGRYQIRARGQTDAAGAAQFAVFAVDVQGRDTEGIELVLRRGAVIEGGVAIDAAAAAKAPPLPTLRVRAPSIDGSRFGDALTGAVQPDGSFALRGIIQGPHQIVIDGLPAPWTLRQVLYRGMDVTDRVIDVNEGEHVRGVRVTITDVASLVDGVVRDRAKQPAADAAVLVFARAPQFWMPTNRRMRAVYTDRAGRFSIAGLPAGEYLAVASTAIDERDLARRDRLRSLEPFGTPLRLETDGARATLTLTLASLP